MSIIILSCEDDSEPPDERPNCCLVSPEEGGKDVFALYPRPVLTLVHKARVQAPLKSKVRPGRGGLRSLISIHVLRDERYLRRRLAILWRSAVYSVEYFPLTKELSHDEAIDAAAHIRPRIESSPACCSTLPSDPVSGTDAEKFHDTSCNDETAEKGVSEADFCLPTIIITPPSTTDDAEVDNAVPTPQDSASGVYLTVPDFDFQFQFTKRGRGYGASCRWSSALKRRLDMETTSSFGNQIIQPKLPIVTLRDLAYVEEEDQEIDLGPTWSG